MPTTNLLYKTLPGLTQDRVQHIASAHILVVDDDDIARELSVTMLRRAGFVNVFHFENALSTLNHCEKNSVDLVLADLVMPKMDGLEFCAAIQNLGLRFPPAILVLTASHEDEHIIDAFSHGAVDYINKPINSVEMITRCIAHLERRFLEVELEKERQRIQSELQEAAHLQQELLPDIEQLQHIKQDYGIDIAASLTFSSELGGDLWGLQKMNKQLLGLYTIDVIGHGLQAALNTFRIHTLIQECVYANVAPAHIMPILNNRLKSTLPTGSFVTMCQLVFDIPKRILHYSTAAAPLPIIVRANGEVQKLKASGLPLGCKYDVLYDRHQFELQSGDVIAVFSDALFEAVPNFNEERVIDILKRRMPSARAMVDYFMVQILSESGGLMLDDDLTLVIIKVP